MISVNPKEKITILSWHVSKNKVINYTKQKRSKIKGKMDKSSTIVGHFYILQRNS